MSVYYSKFSLNTYRGTPYFQEHIPKDYPLTAVLLKSRAFHRLPPRLQKLSRLSRKWMKKNEPEMFYESRKEAEDWYDDDGYELDPNTHKRLTDKQIDEQWSPIPELSTLQVTDIPAIDFADPKTWKPAAVELTKGDEPTREQLIKDISSRGIEAVKEEYGASTVERVYGKSS